MMVANKSFVIFDTEYTTWEGAMARQWMGEGEYKEIIQIGALKVSYPDFKVIDTFVQVVKPRINQKLSDYCISLTGISQNDIDNGADFAVALADFLEFCGDNLAFSYGNDACILAENTQLYHIAPLTLYGVNFANLRYWAGKSDKRALELNSGKLWQLVELPHFFAHACEHDALADCYSLLEFVLYMYNKGESLPI